MNNFELYEPVRCDYEGDRGLTADKVYIIEGLSDNTVVITNDYGDVVEVSYRWFAPIFLKSNDPNSSSFMNGDSESGAI